jgi:hypothetical protein
MNTAIFTGRLSEASPGFKARMAGVFYFLTFLTGAVSAFVGGRLVVSGDAAATANNILAHQPLLWLGFSLVGCAVQAFISLFHLAPLVLLGGAPYLSVFKVEQLRALAFMFLEFYGQGFNICFVFFGFYCLLIGYLIFRSAFLPRILGALMAIGGLGWLTFLLPPFAEHLWPYIAGPGILGEASLTLWLLVMGVNAQRWKERSSAI